MTDDLDVRLRAWGQSERVLAEPPPAGLLELPRRRRFTWQPLAAAAAVAVVAVTAALLALPERDEAGPTAPAPSASPSPATLSRGAYLLRALPDGRALLAASSERGSRLLEIDGQDLRDRTPAGVTSDDVPSDVAVSGSTWWLVTQDCVAGTGVLLWRSTDTGRSWNRTAYRHGVSCSAGSGAQAHVLGPESVVVSYNSYAGEESSLMRSTDGGATWSAQEELPVRSHPTFLSADVAFMTSPFTGKAVQSTDGGRTWLPIPEAAGACSTSTVTALSGTEAVVAYATTKGISRLTTTDAGATWERTPIEYLKTGPSCRAPQLLTTGGRTLWTLAQGGLRPTLSRHVDADPTTWAPVRGPGGLGHALEAYVVQLLPTGDRTALLTLFGDGVTRTYRTEDTGQTWLRLTS